MKPNHRTNSVQIFGITTLLAYAVRHVDAPLLVGSATRRKPVDVSGTEEALAM
jgi:hypothetical protein